jgi:hypothetical protein
MEGNGSFFKRCFARQSVCEIFSKEEGKWMKCASGFGGFGCTAAQSETVLHFWLGVWRWRAHGKMLRWRARVR